MEQITSRENGNIKELAGLLSAKKNRDKSGLFALEGLRLCMDALESDLPVRTAFVTGQALERNPELQTLLDAAEKPLFLSEELAARVSDTRTTQGVFCICPKLDNSERAVTMKDGGKYLLLHGLQDPGNLGTMLRTAQAMGLDGVFAVDCPDLYSPKVLRAAMGGLFRLPVAVEEDMEEVVRRLRDRSIPVYAAALTQTAKPLGEISLAGGCAVLIGNEGNGLPQTLTEQCTGSVIIPMQQDANSLNAATAAAILLWEMAKENLKAGN